MARGDGKGKCAAHVCVYSHALCVILVSLQQITYKNMQEAILCLSGAIRSSAIGSMGDAAI